MDFIWNNILEIIWKSLIGILVVFIIKKYRYRFYKYQEKIKRKKTIQSDKYLLESIDKEFFNEIKTFNRIDRAIDEIDNRHKNINKYDDDSVKDLLEEYNKYNNYKKSQNDDIRFTSTINFLKYILIHKKYISTIDKVCENLITEFKVLIEEIRLKKIQKMNSDNIYVDNNDKKLIKDITSYEPYPGYWEKSDEWINKKISKKIKKLRGKSNRDLNILDIGCGTGRMINFLLLDGSLKSNDTIYLIESDKNRLDQAIDTIQNNVKDINIRFENLFESDEKQIYIKPEFQNKISHCDIIICSHVIQHIHTDIVPLFYSAINLLLKEKGILFLLFPISKSNVNEYVVHGLEFDKFKLEKKLFKNRTCENLEPLLDKMKLDYRTIELKSPIDEDEQSNYWQIKLNSKNHNEILFEIAERKNINIAYRRIYNKGLMCSIDKNIISGTILPNIEQIRTEINKKVKILNPSSNELSSNAEISNSIISRYWLISDTLNNLNIIVADKCDCFNITKVHRVIADHQIYNIIISKNRLPSEFREVIPSSFHKLKLNKKSNSEWDVIDQNKNKIAYIIKTESRYSLILESEESFIYSFKKEELLYKRLPPEIATKYFKENKELYWDSETADGWLIAENNEIKYYVRNDNDWIRVFKPEPVFNEIIEGEIPKYKYDIFPFDLWNEDNLHITPIIKDRLWALTSKAKEDRKKTILPDYKIIRIVFNNSTHYLAYRDKQYNRISRYTFDSICEKEIESYKILPTHRFLVKEVRKELKSKGLCKDSIFTYHCLNPQKKTIDKIILRDKLFNIGGLKYFKWVYSKFNIQDVLMIVKKK